MNIVFYYPAKLPVIKYGGTERIVFWLMKELVKLGHRVTLIGNPDSSVTAIGVKLIPVLPGIDWRCLIPSSTDILHLNQNEAEIDVPYVNTIHGNETPGVILPANSIFVSRNHAVRHHAEAYVYNGIDFSEYPFITDNKPKRDTRMFLANARWEVKNLKDCLRACNNAGKELFVGGGNRQDVFKFFREKHKYINEGLKYFISPKIHFLGMIGQAKKIEYLNKVEAFLWPVRWHEPFGVAIIEAYSQGVPVIASPWGSLPELVMDGTGIICDDFAQFSERVNDLGRTFDRNQIRKYSEERFNSRRMAQNYVTYYERVLSGEKINVNCPYADSMILFTY